MELNITLCLSAELRSSSEISDGQKQQPQQLQQRDGRISVSRAHLDNTTPYEDRRACDTGVASILMIRSSAAALATMHAPRFPSFFSLSYIIAEYLYVEGTFV